MILIFYPLYLKRARGSSPNLLHLPPILIADVHLIQQYQSYQRRILALPDAEHEELISETVVVDWEESASITMGAIGMCCPRMISMEDRHNIWSRYHTPRSQSLRKCHLRILLVLSLLRRSQLLESPIPFYLIFGLFLMEHVYLWPRRKRVIPLLTTKFVCSLLCIPRLYL